MGLLSQTWGMLIPEWNSITAIKYKHRSEGRNVVCNIACRYTRLLHEFIYHIRTGSWKGRGNQYIQLIKVLYCKLLTNGKQLPGFPLEAGPGIEPRPQKWEARVLPLCHCCPRLLHEGQVFKSKHLGEAQTNKE